MAEDAILTGLGNSVLPGGDAGTSISEFQAAGKPDLLRLRPSKGTVPAGFKRAASN